MMKLLLRTAMFAGIAALAVAGTALAGNLHKTMTVNLPDGLVARVEYQGDVAPKVTVERRIPDLATVWAHPAWPRFANLDRISADMDRQFDVMFRQLGTLEAVTADEAALTNWASARALPASTARYSYVAATNGKGFCARSVEITSDGPNGKPRVTSSTSGDCGASADPAAAAKSVASTHSS